MKLDYPNIAGWGIGPGTSPSEANHIRLANGLLISLSFGSFIMTLTFFMLGAYQAALVNLPWPFIFAGSLYLMKAGYTLLTRSLVLTAGISAGYLIATMLGPESYFQLIFLFGSALAITFFSLEHRKLMAFSVLYPIGLLVTLELTDYEPILGLSRFQFEPLELQLLRAIFMVVVWSMMIGHFAYFTRDRRMAQEQLVSSAKMISLGRMATGIAHEINNPLQRIVGHAYQLKTLIKRGELKEEPVAVISEQIQRVAMRIGDIVRGLQTLARDTSGDPFTEVSLRPLLNLSLGHISAQIKSNQIELRYSPPPEAWTVIGREAQLSEVILIVISNALDAILESAETGSRTHSEKKLEKWVEIKATANRDVIQIVITDSGPGIDKKIKHKIFEPFFTTKTVGKGAGLGLSVARGILQAHNGQIQLNENSVHTEFVIRIPRGVDGIGPSAALAN